VLAPNARLRAAVTALAPVTCRPHRHLRQIRLPPNWPRGAPPARPRVRRSGRSSGAVGLLAATRLGGSQRAASAGPLLSGARRYAWALLLARIYEVFPLVCPLCGAEMRIIAFITDASVIRDLLVHLGEPIAAPRVAPARGPPLWDLPAAGKGGGDPLAQPAPAYEFDQRVAW
jgi:hypothetical protein